MKEVIMMSLSTQPKRVKGGNMRVNSKKLMVSLILGFVAVFLFGSLVHAQVPYTTGQEIWTFIDHGSTNRADYVLDVYHHAATDRVYLAGREATYSTSRYKYKVLCLVASTGVEVWRYEAGGTSSTDKCQASEVIVGNDGVPYSCGYYWSDSREYRARIIKHNPATGAADRTWTYDYQTSYREDMLFDIEYGPHNKIYVCGYRESSGQDDQFMVVELDTNLSTGTDVFYIISNSYNNRAHQLKVDGTHIWAGGYTRTGSNYAATMVKLDTNMTQVGRHNYQGAGNSTDELKDVVLPWSGTGAYACGFSYEGSGPVNNFFVARYNDACDTVWTYNYDGPDTDDDRAHALVSASSALFACGYSEGEDGDDDYTVITLTFGPNWIWRYDGTGEGNDIAMDIECDAAGTTIYATGYGVADDGNDIYVSKHNLADTTIWMYHYNGPHNDDDKGRSIAVGTDGNLYVGGQIEGSYTYTDYGALALPQNLPPTVPSLYTPADGAYLNNLTVDFVWSTSSDFETSVSGYYLYYTADVTWTTYDSVWNTDTTRSVALTDTMWYWAVKAQDSQGNKSGLSDTWDFQFDFTDPVAPVLTSPINDAYEFDSTVTFDWQAVTFLREVPSPVTYVIQVDTTDGFGSPIALDTTALLTIDLELPLEEYYYYWHVKAYDAAGNQGPYSGTETFMVDLYDPLIAGTYYSPEWMPGPFDVFSQVTDTWGIDEVIMHYRRPEDPAFFPDTMSEGSDDWYKGVIPALTTASDTVKFYVIATDNAGKESRDPATGYHTFKPTGAVEENPGTINVFAFNVKGNLIKGKATFNLSLPKNSSVTLEIYDASGRLVATPATGMKSAGNHTITWTPKVNGIYFYTMTSSYGRKVGKILNIK